VRSGRLGSRTPERRLAGTFNPRGSAFVGDPVFVGDPLTSELSLAGVGEARLFLHRTGVPTKGVVRATLLDTGPDGKSRLLAEAEAEVASKPGGGAEATVVPFSLEPHTVPAGHRLAVGFIVASAGSTGDTLLYDSDRFPSGVTLPTGRFPAGCATGAAPDYLGPLIPLPAVAAR
jgi:hypothetical protein